MLALWDDGGGILFSNGIIRRNSRRAFPFPFSEDCSFYLSQTPNSLSVPEDELNNDNTQLQLPSQEPTQPCFSTLLAVIVIWLMGTQILCFHGIPHLSLSHTHIHNCSSKHINKNEGQQLLVLMVNLTDLESSRMQTSSHACEGRLTLNVGGTISWAGNLDWIKRKQWAGSQHPPLSASWLWLLCWQLSLAPATVNGLYPERTTPSLSCLCHVLSPSYMCSN